MNEILIVDTDKDELILKSEILGKQGAHVDAFQSVQDATQSIKLHRNFDCLLVGNVDFNNKSFDELVEKFSEKFPSSPILNYDHTGNSEKVEKKDFAQICFLVTRDSKDKAIDYSESITLPTPGDWLEEFEIQEVRSEQSNFVEYKAFERGIQRKVILRALRPEKRHVEGFEEKFHLETIEKAKFNHSSILPVFEITEKNGVLFQTSATPKGTILSELNDTSIEFDNKTILTILEKIGDTHSTAVDENINYRPLRCGDIYIDTDQNCLVSNYAVSPTDSRILTTNDNASISEISTKLLSLASESETKEILEKILSALDKGSSLKWTNIKNFIAEKEIEITTNEISKKRKRNSINKILLLIGTFLIALTSLLYSYFALKGDSPVVRDLSQITKVTPNNSEPTNTLKEFWIDSHEVTVAEYAVFLDATSLNPLRYSHKKQPESKKNHYPPNWERYLEIARRGGTFNGERITVNYPVIMVDWWDAYAYAKWKKGRLPKQEEYTNSENKVLRSILATKPNKLEEVDKSMKYNSRSLYGLNSNANEWTSTMKNHPNYPDRLIPLIQYSSANEPEETEIIAEKGERQPNLGFRVAYDRDPS